MDYDLFVIGGGSGGVRAARMAAGFGASVALAEEHRLGGTCVIRGCVPKKLMVYASSYAEAFEDARGFGWDVGEVRHDWPRLMDAKNREITRLEGIYGRLLDGSGVEVHRSRAVVTGPNSIRLESHGQEVTARVILIATGGTPFVPEFPGSHHAITSNELFELQNRPDRIVIVGGGYIACEFAGVLNGLGSDVTQLYRGGQILRGFDDEARDHIADGMRTKGIDLRTGATVERIEGAPGDLSVHCTDGHVIEADAALYATGRVPYTKNLGLEGIGVALGPGGEVQVDAFSKSSVASIYAVGDVTDRMALTPVAIREGAAFAETVFNDNPMAADHALVPTAVFTQPELGTVGLTEEQVRAEGSVEIYRAVFRPLVHTLSGRDEKMMMKLVVAKEGRKVLGCHIVGHGAGEMIQLAGVAVKMGATKEDFDRTVAVHPTSAEELVTMRDPVA